MRVGPAFRPRLDHEDPYKLTDNYTYSIFMPTLPVATHGHNYLVVLHKRKNKTGMRCDATVKDAGDVLYSAGSDIYQLVLKT